MVGDDARHPPGPVRRRRLGSTTGQALPKSERVLFLAVTGDEDRKTFDGSARPPPLATELGCEECCHAQRRGFPLTLAGWHVLYNNGQAARRSLGAKLFK